MANVIYAKLGGSKVLFPKKQETITKILTSANSEISFYASLSEIHEWAKNGYPSLEDGFEFKKQNGVDWPGDNEYICIFYEGEMIGYVPKEPLEKGAYKNKEFEDFCNQVGFDILDSDEIDKILSNATQVGIKMIMISHRHPIIEFTIQ